MQYTGVPILALVLDSPVVLAKYACLLYMAAGQNKLRIFLSLVNMKKIVRIVSKNRNTVIMHLCMK